MNGRYFSLGTSRNPLAQALSLLVLAVVLVGAVIMGAFVFLTLLGLAVIAFLGFRVRAWWLRRHGRGPRDGGPGPGRPAKGIRYIEGEYEVLDADAEAERRHSSERR
ncbi:MAG TPA: hypothetical protein VF405_06550 [Gammaproteobacteria bacterium]